MTDGRTTIEQPRRACPSPPRRRSSRRGDSDVDIEAELARVRGAEERKRLGLDGRASSSGSRTWSSPSFTKTRARQRHAPHRRPHGGAGLPHRGRAQGPRLQRADARRARPTTALQAGKEFGNRGQCNPTYFTVGNLVKYLITCATSTGMTRRGHRQELRLPHRRRVRSVPLRHVRHRVPQGAPRRRLRRLPRHALPADGRPQAGDRRRRRPRDEPDVLLGDRQGASSPATCSTRSATASAPTRSTPGATERALEKAQEDPLRGARRARRTSSRRSGSAKPILGAVKVDKTHAEAEGQHHRRVLGDDDRGRRQLPAPALPRGRGRRDRHPARRRVAPLQHLGSARTTRRSARISAAPTPRKYGLGGLGDVRRRQASSRSVRAAEVASARRLPDVRARRRASTATTCPTWTRSPRSPRVLQQRSPRRRRPHGGRQADHERRHVEGAHDAQREALRLHAERRRLRRRAVAHHREVPRHDLLPGRDERRRRA